MKRVRIETYCSPHFHEQDQEVEGESIILAIGWTPLKEVDLCKSCRDRANLEQLAEWVNAYGEEPEQPEIDSSLRCPIDPDHCHEGKPFKTLGGRNNHLRRAHDKSPEEAFA